MLLLLLLNKKEKLQTRSTDGWQTLWVTDMPLFHCGSGSSIYTGTAVALLQCRLTLRSRGRGRERAGIHTRTCSEPDGEDVYRVAERSEACLRFDWRSIKSGENAERPKRVEADKYIYFFLLLFFCLGLFLCDISDVFLGGLSEKLQSKCSGFGTSSSLLLVLPRDRRKTVLHLKLASSAQDYPECQILLLSNMHTAYSMYGTRCFVFASDVIVHGWE